MSEEQSPQPSYTGVQREMKTRLSVRLGEVLSKRIITIGGIGTIVAVSLVFFYLVVEVAPLFTGAESKNESQYASPFESMQPLRIGIDEYKSIAWAIYPDGRLQSIHLRDGKTIETRKLFDGPKITAVSTTVGQDDLALGFEDGSVRVGRIGFETTFLDPKEVPDNLKDPETGLKGDETGVLEKGVAKRISEGESRGRFRVQNLVSEIKDPVSVAESPVLLIDHLAPTKEDLENPLANKEFRFAFYAEDGALQFSNLVEKENAFSGEITLEAESVDLPIENEGRGQPFAVLITKRGDNVYVVWDDGTLARIDIRVLDEVKVVEQVDVLPDDNNKLTLCEFVLGRETILCGSSRGGLSAWFRSRIQRDEDEDASNIPNVAQLSDEEILQALANRTVAGDGFEIVEVHRLPTAASRAAVTSAAISQRTRMVVVGYADGFMRLFHVTTAQQLLEKQVADGASIKEVMFAAKDDGLFASTADELWMATLDPKHPEATMASLFLPVWYEGYSEPEHRWESSSGTVEPEPKFGLWPLVFGTLKSTFYTMMFGAPLALLAAIYTSEFLQPRWRMKIKPFIEMMASLPSVVLGFLAAFVFSPFIEKVVPASLACFVTVPLFYALGAFLWHLIPHRARLLLQHYRFLFLLLPLPLGLFAAYVTLGPIAEQWLFGGDIMRWLDGQVGSGVGAWMMLFLPISALVMTLIVTMFVNPVLRRKAGHMSRSQFAFVNLAKFAIAVIAMAALAYFASVTVEGLGAVFKISTDPRGTFVDTYEPRNALVVGYVMGFAVIPIIYTIADDALHTVPNHLRSASLGCGATPWQTAFCVVIPTAMSGLFSALMIGLGRAVGETMIVLMAGGNTAIMDLNIFNGFRTLAGNIAFELPEAAEGSTHARTLFLAALTLFIMTFAVNTVAEVVRLRFRRRAYQL